MKNAPSLPGLSGFSSLAALFQLSRQIQQRLPFHRFLSGGFRVAFLLLVLGMQGSTGLAAVPGIAAGSVHTVGLRTDGTAVATGWNGWNQCNVESWSGLVAIAAGWGHTVGLRGDGTVFATGSSYYGECNVAGWTDIVAIKASGNGTAGLKNDGTVLLACTNSSYGCPVPGWTNVVEIAVGGISNVVALKADGTALALGNGSQAQVAGWSNLAHVAVGAIHTVGLQSNGTVIAIGDNLQGQCNVSGWTNIVGIVAGGFQTLGLKADGTVLIAGNNGGSEYQVAGWTNIVAVAAGISHTAALRADGVALSTSVTVNVNDYGQADVGSWYLGPDGVPPVIAQLPLHFTTTVHGLAKLKVLAVGPQTLSYQWQRSGTNLISVGRLAGTTTSTLTISDAQFSDAGNYAVRVSNGYGAVTSAIVSFEVISAPTRTLPQIAAGGHHTVGLKADGSVLTKGNNDVGQLNLPSGPGSYVAVAAGYRHTIGLRANGTLAAVGWTNNDQCNVAAWQNVVSVEGGEYSTVAALADGTGLITIADRNGAPIAGWQGIVSVAAGVSHYVGLRADGTVIGAGSCDSGTCLVNGWTGVTQVAAGWSHTLGLRGDGTVLVAGTNTYGQCNVTGWSNIVAVAAGTFHSVGLLENGRVLAVGYNTNGQCNVTNWSNIVAISAGEYHTVGLKTDGTVIGTGDNTYGQVDIFNWYLGTNLIAPIITQPPTNLVAIYGRAMTLRVTAAGPGTFAYQWHKDGTNLINAGRITGAASSVLQITNVQGSDAGNYSVIVTNAYGATTSVLARVTTDFPPSLSVGPGGSVMFNFATLPSPIEWSTLSLPGAAIDIISSDGLDARVQTNFAGNITNVLQLTFANPAPANARALWTSLGEFIETRPAGVAATLLMASLRNDTGRDLPALVVDYDLAVIAPTTESMGLRTYWSTSGQPGTWQFLNESTNTAFVQISVPLGTWTNHGSLYLLWADDNGPGGPDTAYAIDNFAVLPPDLLTIHRGNGSQIQISWPLSPETYLLHSATNLNTSVWDPVPLNDIPDANQHRVTLTNDGSGLRFFRLQRQ